MAVVFLCGRPGCGRESSATLQIDAPSETISLVDPRVSRDGVPLCPHHADATTPPVGWTMNDLRSVNRTLAPVRSIGPKTGEIVTARPEPRPRGNPWFQSSRSGIHSELVGSDSEVDDEPSEDPLTFEVSRNLRTMPLSADNPDEEPGVEADVAVDSDETVSDGQPRTKPGDRKTKGKGKSKAPASRPTRRREVLDDEVDDDDKFPWHHHFADDEPQELQAKSPLLSRAFRSSVG